MNVDLELTNKVLDVLNKKGIISDYTLDVDRNMYVIGIQPTKKAEFVFVEHSFKEVVYIDVSKMTVDEADGVISAIRKEVDSRKKKDEFGRAMKALTKEAIEKILKSKPVA